MESIIPHILNIADKSIAVATLLILIVLAVYMIKDFRNRERQTANKQDQIEKEFRDFLIKQYQQSVATQQKVIEVVKENTEVIKAFVESQKDTKEILKQHTEVNQQLRNVLNEHLVAWNLKTIREKK